MNNIGKLNLLLMLVQIFIFSSCSWLDNYIKKIHHDPDMKVVELNEEKVRCEHDKKNVSIYADEIGEDLENLLKICQFHEVKNAKEKVRKCFLILSLYKMLQRPDKITPTSRFFFTEINFKDSLVYSDEYSEKRDSGTWRFLMSLSQSWSLKTWFVKTIEEWVKSSPFPIKVTRDFSNEIIKRGLDSNVALVPDKDDKYAIVQQQRSKIFTRGDEFISVGEVQNYNSALKHLSKNFKNYPQLTIFKNSLNDFSKNGKFDLSCNFEFQKIEQGKLDPLKIPLKSNVIAVTYQDYVVAMSVLEDKIDEDLHADVMAYFFMNPRKYKLSESSTNLEDSSKALSGSYYPKYCFVRKSDSISLENLLFVSYTGRDPAQHLVHMIEYLQELPVSVKSIEKVMGAPRHMILDYPLRLGIEADRASEKQLDKILKLDIPIFNERNLGLVLSSGYLDNVMFFIPDDRGTQSYCSDFKRK